MLNTAKSSSNGEKINSVSRLLILVVALFLFFPLIAEADGCDSGKQCVTSEAAQCLMDCSNSPSCSGVCCGNQMAGQCKSPASEGACPAGSQCVSSGSAKCMMGCTTPADGSCAGACCPLSVTLAPGCLAASVTATPTTADSKATTPATSYDKSGCSVPGMPNVTFPCPLGQRPIAQIIGSLIRWALGLVGALFFVMFLYGGFMYIIAGSNAKHAETGKQTLVNAVIGLAIVVGAYILVSSLVGILGAGLGGK